MEKNSVIKHTPTFCRVCEPSCGLIAEVRVQDGQHNLIKLRPDNDHPVTRGFACHKGIAAADIHHDVDRLNQPLRRVRKARLSEQPTLDDFHALGWDEALTGAGGQLKQILEEHGPGALAVYSGNPFAFNSTTTAPLMSLMMNTGCTKYFNAGTQDCSNKFAAGEAVYGSSTLHPIPDIENTNFLLIIGENPKISHMSFISIAAPMEKIKAAKAKGAKVAYVNPRRIESLAHDDQLLQIRPDTDFFFLAALINEINHLHGFDSKVIADHSRGVDEMMTFIEPYSAASVASITGISVAQIKALAVQFIAAPAAAVHMSVGANMGRQGALCYWLVQMLVFLTGNLDKVGGNRYSLGFYPAAKAGRSDGKDPFFDTPLGPMRAILGALPGNLLPEMINNPADPVKALIVLAGNPLLSIGGGEKLRQAFGQLELLIVVDIYRSATAELADYILPATDMLERSDINLIGLGMQYEPFVQYTDAVIPAKFERKQEWWILESLLAAMDLPSVLDDAHHDPHGRANALLKSSDLSIAQLRGFPAQTAVLPKAETGRFYEEFLQTPDHKVDCFPATLKLARDKVAAMFDDLQAEPSWQIKLINLRSNYMHNSWYQNVKKLKRPGQLSNPLYINPVDAERLKLLDGHNVAVSNVNGSIKAAICIDESLREGVVAMCHGWGNKKTPGMQMAQSNPGVNVNELLPCGVGSYDVVSNQAHMTGIPVEIKPK